MLGPELVPEKYEMESNVYGTDVTLNRKDDTFKARAKQTIADVYRVTIWANSTHSRFEEKTRLEREEVEGKSTAVALLVGFANCDNLIEQKFLEERMEV